MLTLERSEAEESQYFLKLLRGKKISSTARHRSADEGDEILDLAETNWKEFL
jgi:hypothetical protein